MPATQNNLKWEAESVAIVYIHVVTYISGTRVSGIIKMAVQLVEHLPQSLGCLLVWSQQHALEVHWKTIPARTNRVGGKISTDFINANVLYSDNTALLC